SGGALACPGSTARAALTALPRRALPRRRRVDPARALRTSDGSLPARAAAQALVRREPAARRPARTPPARHRGAAAARPADVPTWRPPAEGRHRVDGALPRAALAPARPRGRGARPGLARPAEGAGPRGQGGAPESLCRRASARGRGARQDRLRRPARTLVP